MNTELVEGADGHGVGRGTDGHGADRGNGRTRSESRTDGHGVGRHSNENAKRLIFT